MNYREIIELPEEDMFRNAVEKGLRTGKYSREWVCRSLCVSRTTLFRWLRGDISLSYSDLRDFWLNISMEEEENIDWVEF